MSHAAMRAFVSVSSVPKETSHASANDTITFVADHTEPTPTPRKQSHSPTDES